MATDGLSYAGDREGSRLVLFRTTQGEAERAGFDGDLRTAKLARVIEHGLSPAGLDFQTFLKNYQRPELKFHCPWCDAAGMSVSREMKPDEFVEAGGRIDCIGGIELREGQAFS